MPWAVVCGQLTAEGEGEGEVMNRRETLARISWCEWKIASFYLTYEEIRDLTQEIERLQETIPALREKERVK